VILTTSPRQVSLGEAIRVFEAAPSPKRVGVAGVGSVSEFAKMARALELDVLQLHRGFSIEEAARLRDEFDGEIWAVLPVDEHSGAITSAWQNVADSADALLLDTSSGGRSGGTGKSFNWQTAQSQIKKIEHEIPVVLAGGLSAENVGEAIKILHPTTVDVSSGVESAPGVKDHGLMQAFANAVRSASIV
jgi:phosphoribosylanthranilate isomerase